MRGGGVLFRCAGKLLMIYCADSILEGFFFFFFFKNIIQVLHASIQQQFTHYTVCAESCIGTSSKSREKSNCELYFI